MDTLPGLKTKGIKVLKKRESNEKKPEKNSEKNCLTLKGCKSFTCPQFEQKLSWSDKGCLQFKHSIPRIFFENRVVDFIYYVERIVRIPI